MILYTVMNRTLNLIALLSILFCSPAIAEVIGLTVWQPHPDGPRLLLPRIKDRSPESVAAHYRESLVRDEHYRGLFLKSNPELDLPARGFSSFFDLADLNDRPKIAVNANRPGHMNRDDLFLNSVLRSFGDAGGEPFIVPLGLDVILSNAEFEDYRRLIVEWFPAMLSIGGGDVDPSLYGQENSHSIGVNAHRDRVELALVQRFIEAEKGMFFGICRGHQLAAVARGFRLTQDLPSSGLTQTVHAVNEEATTDSANVSAWHDIEILQEDSMLFRAIGRRRMKVNSRHHQAVVMAPNPTSRIVAADDAIPEAIEFKNGLGLTLQFHPEDMGTRDANNLLRFMVNRAKTQYRLERNHYNGCRKFLAQP